MKKLIIFDLDGTLAESKSKVDDEMIILLIELLKSRQVAVISGGKYEQFQKQFLMGFENIDLSKLYLFPTCGTSFYKFNKGWERIYFEELTIEERKKIIESFERVFKETNYKNPETLYGEVIEDRETQITFSALGQQAPVELKKQWDSDLKKRTILKEALEKYLPEFDVKFGGSTSLDVTKKGIDKGYGIRQILKYLGIQISEMLFIGDALYEGGNDYPVKKEGVECIEVKGSEETKKIIKKIIGEIFL